MPRNGALRAPSPTAQALAAVDEGQLLPDRTQRNRPQKNLAPYLASLLRKKPPPLPPSPTDQVIVNPPPANDFLAATAKPENQDVSRIRLELPPPHLRQGLPLLVRIIVQQSTIHIYTSLSKRWEYWHEHFGAKVIIGDEMDVRGILKEEGKMGKSRNDQGGGGEIPLHHPKPLLDGQLKNCC